MADEKISAMPAVTTVGTTDLATVVATGVNSKITQQNYINALVAFITATVNVGGKITLNPAGNASLANGAFTVDASGNLNINTGHIKLNSDGSIQLANGNTKISASGEITSYNGIGTQGLGISVMIASQSLNGISSTQPPILLTSSSGLFRVGGYLEVTQADISGTIDVTLTYADDNGAQTIDLSGTQSLASAASYPCSGLLPGQNVFYSSGSTGIMLNVTFAADTGNSMVNIGLVLEQLQ
jgi:hypothetical protein